MSFGLVSACGGLPGRDQQQLAANRSEIIERLVPEEGRVTRRKLNTIIEAITTVSRVPNRDIPENALGVRQVLRERSLGELRQIESIVTEAERKRQDSRSE